MCTRYKPRREDYRSDSWTWTAGHLDYSIFFRNYDKTAGTFYNLLTYTLQSLIWQSCWPEVYSSTVVCFMFCTFYIVHISYFLRCSLFGCSACKLACARFWSVCLVLVSRQKFWQVAVITPFLVAVIVVLKRNYGECRVVAKRILL